MQNNKCAHYLTKHCPVISKVKGNSPSGRDRACSHPNKQTPTHSLMAESSVGQIPPQYHYTQDSHNTHYTWPQLETMIIISEGGKGRCFGFCSMCHSCELSLNTKVACTWPRICNNLFRFCSMYDSTENRKDSGLRSI